MSLTDTSVLSSGRRHALDLGQTEEDPWAGLPASLRGRVRDCDSHLILPPDTTYEILGHPLGEPMRRKRQMQYDALDGLAPFVRDGASVWRVKGTMSHGAHDPSERLEVLDEMGIHQQLIFGSGMASVFWSAPDLAYPAASRYNQYAAEWCQADPDRLRPAAIVPCQSPESAFTAAQKALSLGLKAVQLAFYPDFEPAPDDERWEPLWALLGDAGVPALLHWDMRWSLIERAGEAAKVHVRTGQHLAETNRAVSSDELVSQLNARDRSDSDAEFAIMTAHRTPEHFLSALALGGVLRRHPGLRVGVFECTSFWVGPWLERLDALEAALRPGSSGERSSDVVRSSVRITPLYGEPFGHQIRLSDLGEMFVFGTDYPHPEGGLRPLQEVAAQLPDDDMVQAVLAGNASGLFPEN